jgi:hypothetical protein
MSNTIPLQWRDLQTGAHHPARCETRRSSRIHCLDGSSMIARHLLSAAPGRTCAPSPAPPRAFGKAPAVPVPAMGASFASRIGTKASRRAFNRRGVGVRTVKQFHRHPSAMQTANLAATSGHASNDKRSADISSLNNLRIKSLRPSIISGRMNDT